ncbi:cell wall-binding repeat-containing protein [Clostridium sp. WILCCON 0269]|uniref:Cell wall-binding repeat-containing protein n=1 Tax=Candidatus Clostridium eludens TaxID=3381663 RepID=A0ABW8SKG0_9CLOT
MKNINLKMISVLCMCIVISTMTVITPLSTYAATTGTQAITPGAIVTYTQLKAAAVALPQNAQDIIFRGGFTTKGKATTTFIPDKTKIYYLQDATTRIISFYQFYTMIPFTTYPAVHYYAYVYEYHTTDTSSTPLTPSSAMFVANDKTLYKKLQDGTVLSDGTTVTTTNTGRYQHKRFTTMIDIANEFFPVQKNEVNKVITLKNVVIASGTIFADSLSGSVLAAELNAPILLLNTKSDSAVYSFITSKLNKNGTVYILGREGAISTDIENKFKKLAYNVIRIGGLDRYDTCEQVNNNLNIPKGTPVFLASGEDFPDALSAGAVAAIKQYPILVTQKDTLPPQTIHQLIKIKPSAIYVVGGTGVISDNIFNTLNNYSSNVTRISGADRYATSLSICKSFDSEYGTTVIFAAGSDFKDAVCASSLAAKYSAPIILTNNNIKDSKTYIDNSKYLNIYILGGTDEISTDVENALKK